MMRYSVPAIIFVGLVFVATVGNVVAKDERQPNVIVLFIDDMGYADPGCFGNPAVKTPKHRSSGG